MTTPPTPKGVIVSMTTVDSTGAFRVVTFNQGNEWEHNNSPARLTILNLNRERIAEFPAGCFSGVCYKDALV